MKKFKPFLLILLFSMTISSVVQAQSLPQIKRKLTYRNMTHVKEKTQIGLGFAAVKSGFACNALYAYYFKKDLFGRCDFIYENVSIDYSRLNLFYLSPEVNYTVKKYSHWIFVNVKGGFIIGNELMKNSIMVNKRLNKFVIGEKIGVKAEFFVTPEFSINLDLEQRLFNNSMVGSLSSIAYLSFSYNF